MNPGAFWGKRKRKMMKKRRKLIFWKQIGLGTVVCFSLFCPLTVQAGSINAAEQSVINYYNGTFYYNGKNYVATEAAKAAAYQKLAADDVDLTEAEAQSAIRQASKNIASGIEQGYLVEVAAEEPGDGSGSENDGNGTGDGSSDTGNGSGTGDGSSDTGNGSGAGDGSGDTGNGSGSSDTGNGSGTGSSGTGSGSGDGSSGTGTGDGNNDTGNGSGTGDGDTGNSTKEPVKEPDKFQIKDTEIFIQNPGNIDTESGSVQEMLQNLPEDASVITQNYVESEVEARIGDKIILKNTLPVKNTGYDTIQFRYLMSGAGALLLVTIAAAFRQIYFARRHEREK